MKFSIVMTTYKRPAQLYFCLKSIRWQKIQEMDHEILVINDGLEDGTQNVAETSDAVEGLNVRYLYTGYRTDRWRTMGFAANIGIQQATGDIVILTNSDIYHIGNTVAPVIKAVEQDSMALSTVHQVFDDDGRLINYLLKQPFSRSKWLNIIQQVRNIPRPKGFYPVNPNDPFFLAIRRKHLIDLGGYDEDFIGCASEDCDLLDRLKAIGCHYTYAPSGAEAIHLYHGRRFIQQLEADPGFAYNIRLRNERKDILVRNQNRKWGELIDPNAPQTEAPMHMVLWVTSQCKLDCPLCNQRQTRQDFADYNMDGDELTYFITSCQKRNIHFSTIELTGGEPTQWPLFEQGIQQLEESGITDAITFITNGNDAKRTTEIANQHGLYYIVSTRQCTAEQRDIHEACGVGKIWNDAEHRPVPRLPIKKSLPAICSQVRDMNGRIVRQLYYIKGSIWYCCMAYANSAIVGKDLSLCCPFDEDFDKRFRIRKDDLPICEVCLCNKNVWDSQTL